MISPTERLAFLIRRVYHRAKRDTRSALHPLGARSDIEYWDSLKDRHKGQKGFVIGCGPSLSASDLDLLRSEVTLASNRIDLAFGDTQWRPDYFAISDWVLFPKIKRSLSNQYELILGGPDMPGRVNGSRIVRWHWRGQPHQQPNGDGSYCFSNNVGEGIWSGGTISFDLLQIAAHLGCNPIVLVGCDHEYLGEQGIDPRSIMEAPDVQNHFDSDYRKPGEHIRPACLNLMTRAFRHAQAWAEANDIDIVNATRGGSLDIFQRVELESMLAGPAVTSSGS